MVGLWLPHSNCWDEVWQYVMWEAGGSVPPDGRHNDVSPVDLEPELGGGGNATKVGDDATLPVPSGSSGADVGSEASSGSDSSVEGDLSPRPR